MIQFFGGATGKWFVRGCAGLLIGLGGVAALAADKKVEPPAQLSASEAGQLEKTRGVHPRLFLNADRLKSLRAAIKTTHAALWADMKHQADGLVRHGPYKYRLADSDSGDEQLWQRNVGNAMPTLALAWMLSGDRKYLDSARDWALAACSYPTWGLGAKRDGHDLAAGHQLFGLALVYDWCHDDLDANTLATIRETIDRRGAIMATGIPRSRNFLQNHLWVDACGLATAGMATWDEMPAGRDWIAVTLGKWRRTHEALGPDGASHEGAGYWSYGVENLLKFMSLSRDNLGVNFYDHPWWRNTADYRMYLSLPRHAWTKDNCVVDLADCTRAGWSYGPDYLLRGLAHEYGDGHAQWLAKELDDVGMFGSTSPWLNLLWYDPTISPRSPADMPTLRRFDDMEIVSARTDWSGDESLVVFKCGPFIGHKALQMFQRDPGGGHVHPDANHFVAFGAGQWLIRDDGYRTKATSQHNTLLIGGTGQIGEGAMWFRGDDCLKAKADPKILRADSSPAFDHMVGDATEAYPKSSGLKRFVRHLLFVKPNILIVADDIALDGAHPLELRFHPEEKTTQDADGAFVFTGKKAAVRIEPLTNENVEIGAGEDATMGQLGKAQAAIFSIHLRTNAAAWRNAVAISWAVADAKPAKVRLKQQGDQWIFACGERNITLDWKTGESRIDR